VPQEQRRRDRRDQGEDQIGLAEKRRADHRLLGRHVAHQNVLAN
jgi:hypothetical protein